MNAIELAWIDDLHERERELHEQVRALTAERATLLEKVDAMLHRRRALENQLAQSRQRLASLSAGNRELQVRIGRLQAELAGERRLALDLPLLRSMLQLAHPDKHGGSALSEQVTQRLLSMRAEVSA